jgi:hypothetical protein
VAHLDSKSQAVPLLLRAAGIVTLGAAWVAALVMTALAAAGVSVDGWRLLIGVAAVGAAPVLASIVGPHSAGAVDNAAGVATVLTAAALLPPHVPLGVLLTDAEELGLAGSRAWCRERHVKAGIALNCDGVDDVGILTLMWTRPRAPRLERALREAALREGDNLRVIPLIAGVLVDAVALSDCGWEVVTLSRGTISTLRRIHTRRDDRTQLSGSGVAIAARTLARATSEISRND